MSDISETISETISQAQAVEKLEQKRPYPGRERIPFPLAGDGVFMLFTLKGIGMIDATTDAVIGQDWRGLGSTYFHEAAKLLQAGDARMIRACLDVGLKREGPDGKPVPVTEHDLDEIEWPTEEIIKAALNALAVAHFGKRYDTLVAEATAAVEAERESVAAQLQKILAGNKSEAA